MTTSTATTADGVEVLFVDATAWIEVVSEDAPEHAAFKRALLAAPAVVTTNYVVDEVITRCLYHRKLGLTTAIEAGEILLAFDVVRISPEDERDAWDIFRAQPRPKAGEGWSFTDCTSFAVMRRLGLKRAISKDSDFALAGFEIVPPRVPKTC